MGAPEPAILFGILSTGKPQAGGDTSRWLTGFGRDSIILTSAASDTLSGDCHHRPWHKKSKAWTTHERKHAQDRALFAQEEYILPARFDDTPVPGMTTTVGFQDLRLMTPAELVTLILAKLRRA